MLLVRLTVSTYNQSYICSFNHSNIRLIDCLIDWSNKRSNAKTESGHFRIRPGRDARGTAAAERFPLPEGAGRGSLPAQGCRGLKALGRESGKGHPGGRVQRGEDTPLMRVVGGKAPCLNRAKCSVPTEWMRWRSQYFALLSYGKFLNLLFRASGVTATITPCTDVLFVSGSMPSYCRNLMISGDKDCFRRGLMEIQVDTFQARHFTPIHQNGYIRNRPTICVLSALSIRSHVRTEICSCIRGAAPATLGQSPQMNYSLR